MGFWRFGKKKKGGQGGLPPIWKKGYSVPLKGGAVSSLPRFEEKKLKKVPGGSPPDFEIYHSVPLMGGAVTSPLDLEKKMKEGAREVSPRFEIEFFFASGAPECT